MAREDVPVRPPIDVVRPVAARDLPPEDHWPGAQTRYEVKADGWRAVAGVLEEHRPVPYSRQGGDLGAICPEVLDEPRGLPIGTVLDGEPCAVVGDRLEFTALARRRGRGRRRAGHRSCTWSSTAWPSPAPPCAPARCRSAWTGLVNCFGGAVSRPPQR